MSLFRELKRRNVFRVGIAYLAASWLVLEVVDTLVPMLELPAWISRAVLVFLLVGFVVSVFVAWAFELTPEGIKREKEVDRTKSITQVTGRKLDFVIIGLLSIAVAYFALDRWVWNPDTTDYSANLDKSIAVIPFANRSASEDDAFFADGIHDDILTQLHKLSGIDKVISRTSVERYRDTTKTIPEIAAELDVAWILEGGVQRAGDTVRINVQLIAAGVDDHQWAETYTDKLTTENVFEIQSKIATAIAEALQAEISEQEADDLTKLPTRSMAAWEKYQRGKFVMGSRSLSDLATARVYFAEAIELDKDFALAYVGLADSTNLGAVFGWDSDQGMARIEYDSMIDRAKDAAERALVINPRLGQAHASLGYAYMSDDREVANRMRAHEHFRQAAILAPNYADIYRWHAQVLWLPPLNRAAEALVAARRGAALNPMYSLNHVTVGVTAEMNGHFDEAAASFARAIETPPKNEYLFREYVLFVGRRNDYAAAIVTGLDALNQGAYSAGIYYEIAKSYWRLGESGEFVRWSEPILQSGHVDLAPRINALVALGNNQSEQLIRIYAGAIENWPSWEFLWTSPQWDAVYSLARAYVRNDQPEKLLGLVEAFAPGLIDTAETEVWPQAVMLVAPAAWALKKSGNVEHASELIRLGIEAARPDVRQADAGYGTGIADIELHVLNSSPRQALALFKDAVANGYRNTEWLDESPFVDPIREEPEFIAAMDVIRADLAAQRAELEEMERNGELPQLPD